MTPSTRAGEFADATPAVAGDAARRAVRATAHRVPALPPPRIAPGSGRWPRPSRAAIDAERHVVVQAGTGTGKTIGYLVPAVLAGKRVVVATATKALQDQLAAKDLPFLGERPSTSTGRSSGPC